MNQAIRTDTAVGDMIVVGRYDTKKDLVYTLLKICWVMAIQ